MEQSSEFIDALKRADKETIRQIPKADLHNHFVLGGSRAFLKEQTGYDIQPVKHPLHSMEEMHRWSGENIGERFESREMRQLLIEATFVQVKEDGVRLLEIGEDVWALDYLLEHPIAKLYHAGVDVTINSDDILIFDSEVSKEYLTLYQNGVLTAEELDDIRRNGLRRPEGEVTE